MGVEIAKKVLAMVWKNWPAFLALELVLMLLGWTLHWR